MQSLAVALLTLTLILSLALPVAAGDGRIEINQSCAVSTGCSSLDSPGFPVRIGSLLSRQNYVLTSDLYVTDPNVHAIDVFGGAATTIDLNGFEIVGPVSCSGSGTSLSCGEGSGIGINGRGFDHLTIRNGRITGFADGGVRVDGDHARVEQVTVHENGLDGIRLGSGSVVRASMTYRNGSSGMAVEGNAVVEGCTSRFNRLVGISAGLASTVTGNAVSGNGTDGITVAGGSVIRGNTMENNEGRGIVANASLVVDNTVINNVSDGIVANDGSSVQGNVVNSNGAVGGGSGISVNTDSAYRENVVTDNGAGAVTGTAIGNNLGSNYCAGNGVMSASCP